MKMLLVVYVGRVVKKRTREEALKIFSNICASSKGGRKRKWLVAAEVAVFNFK